MDDFGLIIKGVEIMLLIVVQRRIFEVVYLIEFNSFGGFELKQFELFIIDFVKLGDVGRLENEGICKFICKFWFVIFVLMLKKEKFGKFFNMSDI